MASHLFCGLSRAHWVDWQQLHLTLRFLGPLETAVLDDVKEFLSQLQSPSFELQLSGVGQFSARAPNRQRRHVLWVNCSSPPELLLLHKSIDDGLCSLGFPRERRPFSPHITLARLEGEGDERLSDYLQAFAHFSTPPFRVEQLILYRSDRSGPKARYIEEQVIQLTK